MCALTAKGIQAESPCNGSRSAAYEEVLTQVLRCATHERGWNESLVALRSLPAAHPLTELVVIGEGNSVQLLGDALEALTHFVSVLSAGERWLQRRLTSTVLRECLARELPPPALRSEPSDWFG